MVKVFFSFFAHGGAADADGFLQIGSELVFDGCRISLSESFAEGIQCGRVFSCFLLKPVQDLFGKDHADLPVGDDQLVGVQTDFCLSGQVAGGEKDAPQVVKAVIQLPVSQFFIDFFGGGYLYCVIFSKFGQSDGI